MYFSVAHLVLIEKNEEESDRRARDREGIGVVVVVDHCIALIMRIE